MAEQGKREYIKYNLKVAVGIISETGDKNKKRVTIGSWGDKGQTKIDVRNWMRDKDDESRWFPAKGLGLTRDEAIDLRRLLKEAIIKWDEEDFDKENKPKEKKKKKHEGE